VCLLLVYSVQFKKKLEGNIKMNVLHGMRIWDGFICSSGPASEDGEFLHSFVY
jgi:hypothetical protein